MDGVTINTEPLYTKAEIKLFKEYGIEVPKEDLSLFRGSPEKLFYELSSKKYGIKEDINTFIKKGRRYVQEEFNKGIPFMGGFKELHKRIEPYYLLGLVTASPRKSLNRIIERMNLDDYFLELLSGEDTTKNKPHPEPYTEMMKLLNVSPKNTVIIEDSLTGIKSAVSSGAKVIAKSGSVPDNKLFNAHHIIDHLDEISIDLLEHILPLHQ